MANPQKENGYTILANEILEKLSLPGMNGSELRILLFVVRKTYGFNKKQDRISLTQFQVGTGMNRSHVVETIKSLVHKSILLKEKSVYSINKNWETWVVHKRVPSTQKHTTSSTQKHTKSSTQKHTHKRKKDNITKDIAKTPDGVLQGKQWNDLIDLFKPINPMWEDIYKNKTERNALEAMVKKFGFEKMKSTLSALPNIVSRKYAPKITKPTELRRDFGKLIVFYKQETTNDVKKDNQVVDKFSKK